MGKWNNNVSAAAIQAAKVRALKTIEWYREQAKNRGQVGRRYIVRSSEGGTAAITLDHFYPFHVTFRTQGGRLVSYTYTEVLTILGGKCG